MSVDRRYSCVQSELVAALAIGALSADEAAAVEGHTAVCVACREELESFRALTPSLSSWPTDVLRPSPALWDRLVDRMAQEDGPGGRPSPLPHFEQQEWEDVAPGISCKLLATDTIKHCVSMLVRLAPGTDYPPHIHAGVEELHLLDGELWIDDRKLLPGDYSRAEPGTRDQRVWSQTGCTCVLITSTRDQLL
jgi:anti-sigma factor ChrR (cupin superfamily)